MLLKPGQQVDGRRASPSGTTRSRVTSDAQKQMITGHVSVFERRQADRRRWTPASGSSPSTSRSRRPKSPSAARPREDLYIVLAGYDVATQSGDLRGHDQPARELDLARLRRPGARHRPGAAARARVRLRGGAACPDGAATTALLLLLLLLPAGARAQSADAMRAARSRAAQAARRRHHVHVRRLPGADEQLPDGPELPRARGAAREARHVSRAGHEPRPGARGLRRRLRRRRTCSRRRSTKASTAWRGRSRTWSGVTGAAGRRSSRCAGRGATDERRRSDRGDTGRRKRRARGTAGR